MTDQSLFFFDSMALFFWNLNGYCSHFEDLKSVYSEDASSCRPKHRNNLPHHNFTVCSLYLPPGDNISLTDLSDLISELRIPFIIVGDFNAHNSIWDSTQICQNN